MEIHVLAHNVRSLWNVGSFFRTCDCFGVSKLLLSGYTGTPPRREISKTAIGAEEWIPWEYIEDEMALISDYKGKGFTVAGLECGERGTVLWDYEPHSNILVVLGSEVLGMPEHHLNACDVILEIPQQGKKESLNVSVATGVLLSHLSRFL